jgi:alkanesulfonate monooxygenase SsuD/methylene tetrahydromethanopterin reductase-like flavin-dependent oxidoreductase (luciferase family)
MNTFRFGVNVRSAQSRAEWQEKARKIEALGYSSLTVPDHLNDLLAPIGAVVSAAEATTHLRVGRRSTNGFGSCAKSRERSVLSVWS